MIFVKTKNKQRKKKKLVSSPARLRLPRPVSDSRHDTDTTESND